MNDKRYVSRAVANKVGVEMGKWGFKWGFVWGAGCTLVGLQIYLWVTA